MNKKVLIFFLVVVFVCLVSAEIFLILNILELKFNFIKKEENIVLSWNDEILEQFEDKKWVRVGVQVKANIISNYSSSIKNPEAYDKHLEEVKIIVSEAQEKALQNLSESNFKDVHKLQITPGFFVDVTRKGFSELLANPYVTNVNPIKIGHVHD